MNRDRIDHELKCWPPYFEEVMAGRKPFELRYDDRDYQVGDRLWLREWDPVSEIYSGREVWVDVTYVLRGAAVFGLVAGHCILGLGPIWLPVEGVGPDEVGLVYAPPDRLFERPAGKSGEFRVSARRHFTWATVWTRLPVLPGATPQ